MCFSYVLVIYTIFNSVVPSSQLFIDWERPIWWPALFPRVVAGYYSYHPVYDDDSPKPEHHKAPLPMGLPLGGYSRTNNEPYGLLAYALKGDVQANTILGNYKKRKQLYAQVNDGLNHIGGIFGKRFRGRKKYWYHFI